VYGLLIFGEQSIEGERVISGVVGAGEFMWGLIFGFDFLMAVDG